jgi:hypothetical protein
MGEGEQKVRFEAGDERSYSSINVFGIDSMFLITKEKRFY